MIITYKIQNIGPKDIKNAYVGFYHRGANHHTYELPLPPAPNEIAGYIDSIPYEYNEIGYEKIDISWSHDYNGHALEGIWLLPPTRQVLGIAP